MASGYFPVILWIHHFLSSFGPQTYTFYIVISKSVLKETRAESIVCQLRLIFSAQIHSVSDISLLEYKVQTLNKVKIPFLSL